MDFMNMSFAGLLSMLALGSATGNTAQPKQQEAQVTTYTLPSIAGQWQLALEKKDPNQPNCQERYHFGREQVFRGQSGKEFTYGKYLFSDTGNGLPALAIQTEYDNNEADCSGNQIDQRGDILLAYVKKEGNTMYWCSDAEGKKCEMKLNRVLP